MNVLYEIKDEKTMNDAMNSPYSLIVIDIYADWCGPCKFLTPKLNELAKLYSTSDILFCKMNVEHYKHHDVQGLPTIEFWILENQKRNQIHTVLGADFEEVKKTLVQLAGEPDSQQQRRPVQQPQPTPTPSPQKQQQKKQYKTLSEYS